MICLSEPAFMTLAGFATGVALQAVYVLWCAIVPPWRRWQMREALKRRMAHRAKILASLTSLTGKAKS